MANAKDPRTWSVEDVCERLRGRGLDEDHVAVFRREAVDGVRFLALTDEKLRAAGVQMALVRNVVLAFVAELGLASHHPPPPPVAPKPVALVSSNRPSSNGALSNNYKTTKNTPNSSSSSSSSSPPYGFCSAHPEKGIEFYCKQDQSPLCSQCLLGAHVGHPFSSPEEALSQIRADLESMTQAFSRTLRDIESNISTMHKELESLDHEADHAIKSIETLFAELKGVLDARAQSLKDLVRANQTQQSGRIEKGLSDIRELQADCRPFAEGLKALSLKEKHILFKEAEPAFKQARVLLSRTIPEERRIETSFVFAEEERADILKMINNLGQILEGDPIETRSTMAFIAVVEKPKPSPRVPPRPRVIPPPTSASLPPPRPEEALEPQPTAKTIEQNPKPPHRAVEHFLFAVGGEEYPVFHDTVEQYDPVSQLWTTLPNMHFKRGGYPAACVVGRRLYVAGGASDGDTYLETAEYFDLDGQMWTVIDSMKEKRAHFSGVLLEDGFSFVVTGGYRYEGDHVRLVSCEKLDTRTNTWSFISSLSSSRESHASVLYRGSVVVLGGTLYGMSLASCETYNPVSNKWYPFPSFLRPRCYFGAAVISEKIFIAGGYNNGAYASVEIFDGTQWSMLSTSLFSKRSSCACIGFLQRLVVVGGSQEAIETYDPFVQFWAQESIPQMNTPIRKCLTLAVLSS